MTQLSTEQQKREVARALFQADKGPLYFLKIAYFVLYLSSEIQ